MKLTRLSIDAVSLDRGTAPREALSEETVEAYAELMRGGAFFPPIVTFYDEVEYWLADGFHRVHAAKRVGANGIAAEVHPGSRRDAILYAVNAKLEHGLPRTEADKRRAVSILLNDTVWRDWTDSQIARRCGVPKKTVAAMRAALGAAPPASGGPRLSRTRQEPGDTPDDDESRGLD